MLRAAALLAMLSLLPPAPLEAQQDVPARVGFRLWGGGGLSAPLSPTVDDFDTGIHAHGGLEVLAPSRKLGVRAEVLYQELWAEQFGDNDDQTLGFAGSVLFHPRASDEGTFDPYLLAGGGYFTEEFVGGLVAPPVLEASGFGVSAGAGLRILIGESVAFYGEGRWLRVLRDGGLHQVSLTVGFTLGGS